MAGQVGAGGLAQPIGDMTSKEGMNRFERQGKDDKGQYAPGPAGQVAQPVADGAKTAAGTVQNGVSGAAGSVGGLFGQKK